MKKILKKKYNKIGILGGTFDPPHNGHLYISKFALKKLKLNKLLWIVTKKNPLKKKPYLNIKTRIKLSKSITKKEKNIFVMYFDDKIKSNNTYNLLNYLKKKHHKSELFFLLGADNFAKFYKWKNWKKIPKLAKIAIFPRKNYSLRSLSAISLKGLNKSDLIYMNSKKIDISSSLIRKFW